MQSTWRRLASVVRTSRPYERYHGRGRMGLLRVRHVACANMVRMSSTTTVWTPPELVTGTKSLNVTLVGAPNAGKSSILNAVLGEKVSAVSRKYNTTRERVLGVCTRGRAQIVFFDTPGIVTQGETGRYFRSLVVSAAQAVPLADVVVLVVDVAKRWDSVQRNTLREVVALAAHSGARLVVAANKADLLRRKPQLLADKVEGIVQDWDTFATQFGAAGPEDGADVASARLAELHDQGPPDDWGVDSTSAFATPAAATPRRQRQHSDADADTSASSDRTQSQSTRSRPSKLSQRMGHDSFATDVNLHDDVDGSTTVPSHTNRDGATPASPPYAAVEATEEERLQIMAADVPSLLVTSTVMPGGLTTFTDSLFRMAVPRPWHFSASVVTDMTQEERVREVIREQLFATLNQEVPYKVRQENKTWEVMPNGALLIEQDIIVPSSRHARMLMARGGEPLRRIASVATKDLENMFDRRVRLGLTVVVSRSQAGMQ